VVQSLTEIEAHEKELNSTSMLTTIVVLVIMTATFGALIAVFFVRAQTSEFWQHIEIPRILWATTAVLLVSSVSLEVARRQLRVNDQPGFFRWTALTTGLAVLFLAGQLVAWFQVMHSGRPLQHNPHSWFIFLFSGLHGMHILLGLGGLGYLLYRTRLAASGPKYKMKTRAIANGVSIFWHYVDFVWIVLFVLLALWRR
jgi:cytochrome c oxidase subunit III